MKDTTQDIRKLAVSATKTSDDAGVALKNAEGAVSNIENVTGREFRYWYIDSTKP